MASQNHITVESLTRYKELIAKENVTRTEWASKYGDRWNSSYRPVEPFERTSCSRSALESPMKAPPKVAMRFPELYRDSVGDEGLAGGTAKRFGGKWDLTTNVKGGPPPDPDKPLVSHSSRKGPHECYCEVGFGCWGKDVRSENFGRRGVFAKELWTNTPGELALVWQTNDGNKELADLDAAVARG